MKVLALLILIGLFFYVRHKNARDNAQFLSFQNPGANQGKDVGDDEEVDRYEEMLQRERVEDLWAHHHHGDGHSEDS